MTGQPVLCTKVPILILVVLTFLFTGAASAVNAASSDAVAKTGPTESVHAILSEMSDEQVRTMLIAELQKDAATENSTFSLDTEAEGPAAPIARILKILDTKSGQSENQLELLWQGIPNLLPDLYKVFVSL